MTRARILLASLVLVIAAPVTRARAQAPTIPPPGHVAPAAGGPPPSSADEYKQRAKELDDQLNTLFTIPETPAAFALGVSAETVAHPGTVREAAAQLLAYLGPGGSIKPGLAVEVAPFRPLFARRSIDAWNETAKWYEYPLDGLRFSLATAADPAAPPDMAPTLVSVGARVPIWDERDYRRSKPYIQGVRTALNECFPGPGGVKPDPSGGGPQFHDDSNLISASCAEKMEKRIKQLADALTKGLRVELAGAVTIGQTQPPSQADWRSTQLWTAADYGFGHLTLGAAATLDWHDDAFGTRVSSQSAGLRASVESTTTSWSLGVLYGNFGQSPVQGQTDKALKYGTALDVKAGTYGLVRAGLQAIRDFDAHSNSVLVLVSLATASGEPVWSRVFGAK